MLKVALAYESFDRGQPPPLGEIASLREQDQRVVITESVSQILDRQDEPGRVVC